MERVQLCGLILVFFSGVVHSLADHRYGYRGGTISYKPRSYGYGNTVEFSYRLAFDLIDFYCDAGNTGHSVTWTNTSFSPWAVTRFSYYNSSSYYGIYGNQLLCSSFSSEDGWSEGNNLFTFQARPYDVSLIAKTYNHAYWILGNVSGHGGMLLSATVNTTTHGVFNNSSPVSSLPLTVYVVQGIPSVIRIPVVDPDGDIVRCRNARYQECYRGMCTYFPYGVLDEGNCTLSYNGAGSVVQLFPIILKLEDFPSGTTQFDSSNSLGSVDLQFVVHIKNAVASTSTTPAEENATTTTVANTTAPATAAANATAPVENATATATTVAAPSVRIQGAGSSGLLQVLHNGVWGTVCDDDWSMTNTHVVCRQLGFAGALLYYVSGGVGTGPIWLDNVQCSGSESAIQQCRHRGWGINDCGHGEDVFITCYRDECSYYTVLSASNRAQGYRGIKDKCDKRYITPAWYRFMGDAGTAMATSCIPLRHCGTAAPGWMRGSHPTQAEGVVTRTACFHWNNDCCARPNSIRVKNCGGFYVYQLVGPTACDLRYCGNNTDSNNTCVSSPCRNGATCVDTDYGYNCSCPYGYTGRHCETDLHACSSNPCRNGGTCRGGYGWYRCDCPSELTGQQCESNINTNVTCGENYMQIDLEDSFFSDIDWRNLHLKDPSCRATKTADTKRLRAPLNSCGTTYTETQKTITFWNEVKTDNRYQPVGNGPAISRDGHLLLRFFCAYERSRFVSTSFLPSKKTVVASEGSYGNFTFTMDLYQYSNYSTPYPPFDYPVVVYPNQPLWVQYEVKNTNADLVVFAENCHATPSNDPNATPQHVFLQRGCVRDRTMVYLYDPYSKVQRFSIRSFRFVYSNTFLVYLHCELLVCHRNSTNSRCAQGCISGSRRRRETAEVDGSKAYDLSAGPLKGGKINAKSNNQEGSLMSKQLIGGLGAVGGVFFVITILLSVIVYRNRRRGQDNKPTSIALDVTVNSYEQSNVDSDEKNDIEL